MLKSTWAFERKINPDGSLNKNKARAFPTNEYDSGENASRKRAH